MFSIRRLFTAIFMAVILVGATACDGPVDMPDEGSALGGKGISGVRGSVDGIDGIGSVDGVNGIGGAGAPGGISGLLDSANISKRKAASKEFDYLKGKYSKNYITAAQEVLCNINKAWDNFSEIKKYLANNNRTIIGELESNYGEDYHEATQQIEEAARLVDEISNYDPSSASSNLDIANSIRGLVVNNFIC